MWRRDVPDSREDSLNIEHGTVLAEIKLNVLKEKEHTLTKIETLKRKVTKLQCQGERSRSGIGSKFKWSSKRYGEFQSVKNKIRDRSLPCKT